MKPGFKTALGQLKRSSAGLSNLRHNIKSTAKFDESKIIRQPVNYISNTTDRLLEIQISVKSVFLSEDEFVYWSRYRILQISRRAL